MNRRFRRRLPSALGVTSVLILLAIVVAARWLDRPPQWADPGYLSEGIYQVERVVDGDTIDLSRRLDRNAEDRDDEGVQRIRVRLMGVDTPETVKPDHPVQPWGPEATEFTKRFVAGGSVRLRLDKERLDRYGRVLGYLYVDDVMLNEQLLVAGLARAQLKFRYSKAMKRRFREAQEQAQIDRKGIWSE